MNDKFFLPKVVQNQKAFSLVEIVIIVMIAGFIVLLLSNLPSSLKLIGVSTHESKAKDLAQKKVEDVRGTPFVNISLGTTPVSDPGLSSLPGGSGEVLIEPCPDTICTTQAEKDLIRQATIKISWQEQGNQKDVQVTTLVTDGGLK
jgi:hypothetical protein